MEVVLCVERMNIEQQCDQLDKEIVHAVTNLLQEISPEECLSLISSTLLTLQTDLDYEDDTLSRLSNSTPGVGKSQLDSESCSVQEVLPSAQSLLDVNRFQTDLTLKQGHEPQASLREAELRTTDNQSSTDDFRGHSAETGENVKIEDEFPRRHRPSMMDDLRRKQAKERRAKRSKEKQMRSGGAMFAAALNNVAQSSGSCASDEVMVNRRKDDGLDETAVAPKICSKRKRKLEDLEYYNRCNDVKHSDIKRAKIVEEDVNNNDVTHLKHKYNVCPKTGKLFQKAKVKMLSAKNRRIKLRKQPNLLIQAVRRNMLLQAMASRRSCCPKRCFLRRPNL